jgi:hypothetical protein
MPHTEKGHPITMAKWVEDDQKHCKSWFYNVRGSSGTVNGPVPTEYPIALVEYWKEDPFGYRAWAKDPGEANFRQVGDFSDLAQAKTAAENATANTLRLLAHA